MLHCRQVTAWVMACRQPGTVQPGTVPPGTAQPGTAQPVYNFAIHRRQAASVVSLCIYINGKMALHACAQMRKYTNTRAISLLVAVGTKARCWTNTNTIYWAEYKLVLINLPGSEYAICILYPTCGGQSKLIPIGPILQK